MTCQIANTTEKNAVPLMFNYCHMPCLPTLLIRILSQCPHKTHRFASFLFQGTLKSIKGRDTSGYERVVPQLSHVPQPHVHTLSECLIYNGRRTTVLCTTSKTAITQKTPWTIPSLFSTPPQLTLDITRA